MCIRDRAGTVTNGIIPASGGSATAKAGNGTQSWNKSATITTYQLSLIHI